MTVTAHALAKRPGGSTTVCVEYRYPLGSVRLATTFKLLWWAKPLGASHLGTPAARPARTWFSMMVWWNWEKLEMAKNTLTMLMHR